MMFSRFFSLTCIIKSKSSDALVKCVFNLAKQRKGQIRVTNGVSRDSARMTKSMEKRYIRGQF